MYDKTFDSYNRSEEAWVHDQHVEDASAAGSRSACAQLVREAYANRRGRVIRLHQEARDRTSGTTSATAVYAVTYHPSACECRFAVFSKPQAFDPIVGSVVLEPVYDPPSWIDWLVSDPVWTVGGRRWLSTLSMVTRLAPTARLHTKRRLASILQILAIPADPRFLRWTPMRSPAVQLKDMENGHLANTLRYLHQRNPNHPILTALAVEAAERGWSTFTYLLPHGAMLQRPEPAAELQAPGREVPVRRSQWPKVGLDNRERRLFVPPRTGLPSERVQLTPSRTGLPPERVRRRQPPFSNEERAAIHTALSNLGLAIEQACTVYEGLACPTCGGISCLDHGGYERGVAVATRVVEVERKYGRVQHVRLDEASLPDTPAAYWYDLMIGDLRSKT